MPETVPRQSRRYILNVLDKMAHDRVGLTEMCNTDQIIRKRLSSSVPASYRHCQHCMGLSV